MKNNFLLLIALWWQRKTMNSFKGSQFFNSYKRSTWCNNLLCRTVVMLDDLSTCNLVNCSYITAVCINSARYSFISTHKHSRGGSLSCMGVISRSSRFPNDNRQTWLQMSCKYMLRWQGLVVKMTNTFFCNNATTIIYSIVKPAAGWCPCHSNKIS